MTAKVITAILETFLLFGAGALALRLKMIENRDVPKLSALAMNFFMPCLVFVSVVRNFTLDHALEFGLMPILGFGFMIFGALGGILFKRAMFFRTREREAAFHHICAINNYVFLPILIVGEIFSERHVTLLLVMNVGSTVGFWTIGIITLTGFNPKSIKNSLRNIFSINVVAVLAAVLVSFSKLHLPACVLNAANALGNITIPMIIFLTGAILCRDAASVFLHKRDVLYLSFVRLILMPLLLIGLLKLLPLPRDIYETCFVVALMPAAVASAIITELYGGSEEFTVQAILVTTVLSIGTIPLLMLLL